MTAKIVKLSKPWARVGYGARGFVYLMVGGLAVMQAFGAGGEATNSKGAISGLTSQPFGIVILAALAAGLACYAAWRFSQAILDADNHGLAGKATFVRAALAVSCISHFLLCLYCLSLVFGIGGGGGGSGSAQDATAWLMGQPFGRYLVGAVAVFIGIAGVSQLFKGMSGQFCKAMHFPPYAANVSIPICGFGLSARGFTFLLISGFFLYAAITVDAEKAGGLEDALHWLQGQPYGIAVFAVTAIGLFAFGIYSFMQGAWRRLDQ